MHTAPSFSVLQAILKTRVTWISLLENNNNNNVAQRKRIRKRDYQNNRSSSRHFNKMFRVSYNLLFIE